ncbi:MAG: RNA polymerase sigma factor [Candidatus Tyrphobacter sp.]
MQSAVSTVWLAADALRDDLRRFLRRRLYHEHAVEDVLQDFYLRVFENAHLLKDDRSVRSWLYKLLRSSLVDYARADVRQCNIALRLGLNATPFVPESPFLDRTCTNMLDDLKPEYSDILVRMRLRRDTAEEAAADLGTTPNNIRVRHFRARAALRNAYARGQSPGPLPLSLKGTEAPFHAPFTLSSRPRNLSRQS